MENTFAEDFPYHCTMAFRLQRLVHSTVFVSSACMGKCKLQLIVQTSSRSTCSFGCCQLPSVVCQAVANTHTPFGPGCVLALFDVSHRPS